MFQAFFVMYHLQREVLIKQIFKTINGASFNHTLQQIFPCINAYNHKKFDFGRLIARGLKSLQVWPLDIDVLAENSSSPMLLYIIQ